MVTKVIDLDQHPDSLDDLLAQLDASTELLLMRGDTPIARITPEQRAPLAKRIPGLHAGTTWVSSDFDAPLPDSFWLGEE